MLLMSEFVFNLSDIIMIVVAFVMIDVVLVIELVPFSLAQLMSRVKQKSTEGRWVKFRMCWWLPENTIFTGHGAICCSHLVWVHKIRRLGHLINQGVHLHSILSGNWF